MGLGKRNLSVIILALVIILIGVVGFLTIIFIIIGIVILLLGLVKKLILIVIVIALILIALVLAILYIPGFTDYLKPFIQPLTQMFP